MRVKGIVYLKMIILSFLSLTPDLPQTSFEGFFYWIFVEHKRRYFKEWWRPATIDFHIRKNKWESMVIGFHLSSFLLNKAKQKLKLLCNKSRVSTSWQNFHLFGWTMPSNDFSPQNYLHLNYLSPKRFVCKSSTKAESLTPSEESTKSVTEVASFQ